MKLKERIICAVMTGLVLLTIVLVLDVETRLTSGSRSQTPAHARVQYSFRQRHLQKTSNGSREASLLAAASAQHSAANEDPALFGGVGSANGREEPKATSTVPPDPYKDIELSLLKVSSMNNGKKTRRHKHWNPSLGELLGIDIRLVLQYCPYFVCCILKTVIY